MVSHGRCNIGVINNALITGYRVPLVDVADVTSSQLNTSPTTGSQPGTLRPLYRQGTRLTPSCQLHQFVLNIAFDTQQWAWKTLAMCALGSL